MKASCSGNSNEKASIVATKKKKSSLVPCKPRHNSCGFRSWAAVANCERGPTSNKVWISSRPDFLSSARARSPPLPFLDPCLFPLLPFLGRRLFLFLGFRLHLLELPRPRGADPTVSHRCLFQNRSAARTHGQGSQLLLLLLLLRLLRCCRLQ